MPPLASSTLSHTPGNSIDLVNSTDESQPKRLRRAKYVHVVDLVPSVDIVKVEREMARIKHSSDSFESESSSEREEGRDVSGSVGNFSRKNRAFAPRPFSHKLFSPNCGFNLCLLVGKVDLVVDKVRVDKSRVRLAEVEVGDETGTVSLRARDDQIDIIEEVSRKKNGAIVLRNCTLELFQGKHLRVAITKWGKMRAHPDNIESTPSPPTKMNLDLNFSMVDLNLVEGNMTLDSSSTISAKHELDEASLSIGKMNSSQLQHGRNWKGNRGYGENPYSAQAYDKNSSVRKSDRLNSETNYATFPLPSNPNIYSFSPIYGGQQLFGYDQPQLLEGRGISSQPLTNQQQINHQKQQQLLHFQMQQMQLYQQHERQMFHPAASAGHQSTNSEMIDSGGDISLPAINSNFILNTNPIDQQLPSLSANCKTAPPVLPQGITAQNKTLSDVQNTQTEEIQFRTAANQQHYFVNASWAGDKSGTEYPARMNPKAASFAPSTAGMISSSHNQLFNPQQPSFITTCAFTDDRESNASNKKSLTKRNENESSVVPQGSSLHI